MRRFEFRSLGRLVLALHCAVALGLPAAHALGETAGAAETRIESEGSGTGAPSHDHEACQLCRTVHAAAHPLGTHSFSPPQSLSLAVPSSDRSSPPSPPIRSGGGGSRAPPPSS